MTAAGRPTVPAAGASFPERLRPRPLEVATCITFGTDEEATRLRIRGTVHPRQAVEEVVRRALRRTPCLVSFSGGRDSSTILAVAAAVARTEGLPLPVPVTLRFHRAPLSQESEWQEQVVRHLDLPDWERIELSSELDLVAPLATARLRRHGLLWPPFTHFHSPIFELGVGGTVLTGVGGDEMLRQGVLGGLRGRSALRRSNLRRAAMALSPRPVRRAMFARRAPMRFPWLTHDAEAEVIRRRDDERARTPYRWDANVARFWRSRYRVIQLASLGLLAADIGTEVVSPFFEPSVVAALARHFGFRGPERRDVALRELFGDVLPEPLVTRRTKAAFTEAVFGELSREFAASWTGTGVDLALVDPDRLATEWRAPRPHAASSLLLQQAWLAHNGGGYASADPGG